MKSKIRYAPSNEPDSPGKRRDLRGWIVSGFLGLSLILVLLYMYAAPIGERFLEISRQSNPSAFRESLSAFIELAYTHTPYPTYTPPPTYTPFPTSTATFTPTSTPTPTYTPTPTFTPTPTNTPTPTPIPPAAVVAHIHTEEKAELVVADMLLSERDFHVGISDGLCSFGGDFTAQGTIEGGVDLTSLDEASVEYDALSQVYTLKLPAPMLTGCSIDYIRLIDNDFTMCNTDFDLLRRFGEVQVMQTFVNRAIERGIISTAEERSALVLEDLVRTFTGKRVRTEFQSGGGRPQMDSTCTIRGSGSWRYNKIKNEWKRR